jgi:hypothetical protein
LFTVACNWRWTVADNKSVSAWELSREWSIWKCLKLSSVKLSCQTSDVIIWNTNTTFLSRLWRHNVDEKVVSNGMMSYIWSRHQLPKEQYNVKQQTCLPQVCPTYTIFFSLSWIDNKTIINFRFHLIRRINKLQLDNSSWQMFVDSNLSWQGEGLGHVCTSS